MFESLEARTLLSSVDTSSVGLYAPDGSPTAIQKHEPLWIVIHGLQSDKNDPSVQSLAYAVQRQEPNAQSLILGWGALASPRDNGTAYRNAAAAADKIANFLLRAHIPASRVNLIGFSMGGQIEDRIARDLKTKTTQVNCLIAIDPAAPSDNGHRSIPSFATDATYSIAFWGRDSNSFAAAPLSAASTVVLTGLSGSAVQQHVETAYLFGTMIRRDAGIDSVRDPVSPLFSLANLSTGNLPAWKKDAYSPGYEATLTCDFITAGSLQTIEPVSLTYLDRRGRPTKI